MQTKQQGAPAARPLPSRRRVNPPQLERLADLLGEAYDTLADLIAEHPSGCRCDHCTPDLADPELYQGLVQELRQDLPGFLYMIGLVRDLVSCHLTLYTPQRISFRRATR